MKRINRLHCSTWNNGPLLNFVFGKRTRLLVSRTVLHKYFVLSILCFAKSLGIVSRIASGEKQDEYFLPK